MLSTLYFISFVIYVTMAEWWINIVIICARFLRLPLPPRTSPAFIRKRSNFLADNLIQ